MNLSPKLDMDQKIVLYANTVKLPFIKMVLFNKIFLRTKPNLFNSI